MESFEQDAMSLPEETLDNQEISASVTNRLFSGGFEIGLPQAPKRTPRETQPATAMRIPAAPTPELRRQPAVTPPPLPQPAQTIDEETFQAALEAQGGLLSRAWNYLSVRNRSLVIASTPLVAVLVSLVSITPLASISPESIGSLMEALSPSMISQPVAHLPPSSLAIKQASIKFTKTSSQERLALISGVLVNTSNTTLSGVTLEGLVFNRRGEIVGSSQAPLRSALAKENVAELSLATVKKFQGSLNARSASIAAGESVPFTIALLNEPNTSDEGGTEAIKLRKIKYFSARVFSVN
jgi:hypothetical protein